jgi:TolA-binding protein
MRFVSRRFLSLTLAAIISCAASHSTHAAQGISSESARLKFYAQLKPLNFGDYLPLPEIRLELIPMKKDEIPKEFRAEKEFVEVEKIFALQEEKECEKAYLLADKFITQRRLSGLAEWAQILKADLLFQVQEAKEKKNLNLVLEEYQDALRRYPLNAQNARVLYQMGLLQLKMKFFGDVNAIASRGLKEFEGSEYAPLYRLLDAEQAFQSHDDLKASFDFSAVIQKYPRSRAAVDSAFRKAFILFRKGDFKTAYKVYEELEKFHSDEMERLRMQTEASSGDRFVDRIYFAETVFLNEKYREAAKLFQDLANLFPNHSMTPHLLLRLGDTYLWRGQVKSAENLYREVLARFGKDPLVASASQIKLADLYFLSFSVMAASESESLYRLAFEQAKDGANDKLAALALARLSAHYLFFKIYPKAQATLKEYRKLYKDSINQSWVEDEFIKTVELEILDYYYREDYLAALTTYLVFERDQANHFQNTKALLKIADSASRLGLRDKASQILNRVIYLEKTPEGRQEALLRLVDLLIGDKEFRKASERLRRFSFAYPTTSLAYLYEMYWGNLYLGLNNHQQATSHYEKAISLAKSDPHKLFELRFVFMRLAEEYQKASLPLKAVEAYERYVSLVREVAGPKLSDQQLTKKDLYLLKFSKYRISDIHFQLHDYVKALESYRIVVKEVQDEPFLSHARYRIGECLLALDDRKAALAAFREVFAADAKNVWVQAAKSYIASVEMEVKYGIRIFN